MASRCCLTLGDAWDSRLQPPRSIGVSALPFVIRRRRRREIRKIRAPGVFGFEKGLPVPVVGLLVHRFLFEGRWIHSLCINLATQDS